MFEVILGQLFSHSTELFVIIGRNGHFRVNQFPLFPAKGAFYLECKL